MFGFVIPETWNSHIHMYDKYGHISPFSFPAKKYISKSERDSPLNSLPEFSLTELEDDESYRELKKVFEKIGDSYLSSIQVDARIPLLRQTEFKMDMSTVNSSLSVDLAKIAGNIPENDAIPEDIIRQAEPVMQQCANSLADMIDRYNQEFRSYLSLKELENAGYDRYLYLCEKTAATCKFCASRHGQVYSMLDLAGRKHIIPPVHSNCKCSLIAMDRNAEERYNADKQEFLDKIEEEIYNSFSGIYRLDPDMGLTPVPTVFPSNTIITNDSSDSRWYENLGDWAFNFGEDAKAAWDAFFADAATRGLNWNKDVPSFLDFISLGLVSGLYNSFTEQFDRAFQDPSVYTVANWLLLGIPDMVNGAINPDEPFSFDHWMNSLGVATLLVGGYKMAKGSIASEGPSIRPNQNHPVVRFEQKTQLDYTPTSGIKLEASPGRTTTILGTFNKDTKKILNELEYAKGTNFGARKGEFNLLNTPGELYKTSQQFWNEYNKPWLDNAIRRKDVILLATKPTPSNLYGMERGIISKELTGFGKEFEYLLANGYRYDSLSMQMIPQ